MIARKYLARDRWDLVAELKTAAFPVERVDATKLSAHRFHCVGTARWLWRVDWPGRLWALRAERWGYQQHRARDKRDRARDETSHGTTLPHRLRARTCEFKLRGNDPRAVVPLLDSRTLVCEHYVVLLSPWSPVNVGFMPCVRESEPSRGQRASVFPATVDSNGCTIRRTAVCGDHRGP